MRSDFMNKLKTIVTIQVQHVEPTWKKPQYVVVGMCYLLNLTSLNHRSMSVSNDVHTTCSNDFRLHYYI